MTEIIPLSFGRIALKDNTQIYNMRIRWQGIITHDIGLAPIENGHPAEYLLAGFEPNILLNVYITTPSTETEMGAVCCLATSQFNIQNFDYPATILTDANGDATLFVGATLFTKTGGAYRDGIYYINLNITISN